MHWSPVPKFQGDNFYKNLAIVSEIKKLATRKGCSTTQIALAWVAAQGLIAIPGTTKPKRLEENWASRHVNLTEEEKQEMRQIIDAAKPHGNRYAPEQQATVGHWNDVECTRLDQAEVMAFLLARRGERRISGHYIAPIFNFWIYHFRTHPLLTLGTYVVSVARLLER